MLDWAQPGGYQDAAVILLYESFLNGDDCNCCYSLLV